ncbi:tyrosine-type recombinase/integrase [Leptospira sp. GIMC2001]|uniref:tyrosine-type recombinase/integrase n=1 Tax=Leptospira sp. GIMC2001 TaxID=1513297 RepID=UPI00234B0896|nr:tyrosine-type recombinase/integrase [Leptospira sp. GIMC2001]WCL51311.1 tyrosine-type recombinase/integrase [Leptospira sp. GIMC2001]
MTPKMKECIQIFRVYLDVEKNYSEHTQSAYLRDLKFFLIFCLKEEIDFLEIEVVDVRSYFADLGRERNLDKKTQTRKLSSLRTFYRCLFQRSFIESNPILSVSFPKTKKRLPKAFSPIETEEILEYEENEGSPILERRDKAILEILYSSGMRVFELVNAKMLDLSNDRKTIKVMGKRRKERFVYLGPEARLALEDYLIMRTDSNEEEIFLNQRGKKLTTRGVRYILNERRKAMGFEKSVTPHKFRHTFATDLLDAGADIRAVQELLGHSSLSSTQVYLSVSKDKLKEIYRKAHPHAKLDRG